MIYNGFDTLKEALDAHRAWVYGKESGKRLDLRGANLSGADLRGADLHGADLSDADLIGANLSGADLSGANLRDADFIGANLSGANLRDADFIGANLSGANLRDADFTGANLRSADLSGADLRDGFKWERYLSELVPALLTAGGKTLEEVVTQSWNCHSWQNCPMAVAFGVHKISDIPPLYQREAELFVTLFDSKQIPNPLAPTTAAVAA